MVNGAERVLPSIWRDRDHCIPVASLSRSQQRIEDFGLQPGHIARGHQIPLRSGVDESGDNSSHRTEVRVQVGGHWISEILIAGDVANQGHRAGRGLYQIGDPIHQKTSPPRQQSPAHQNVARQSDVRTGTGGLHERMIALRFFRRPNIARGNPILPMIQLIQNKAMLFCFRTAGVGLMSMLSLSAASLPESQVRRATSVVRVDVRTGRLVRTVVVPPKAVVPKVIAPFVLGEEPVSVVPNVDSEIGNLVEQAAKQYDVDPLLIHSVIKAESGYNPYALSPKGAQGLMQLIPSTARRFGVRNAFDPKENIEAGVKYLKYLNTLYPNDLRLAIAAYNAGEGAVSKYNNNIPPYRETEQYVYRVGENYGKALRAAKKKAAEAKPATPAQPVVAEEKHNPVEQFVDAEGRLHLVTKTAGVATP